jgi:hypothetical protein
MKFISFARSIRVALFILVIIVSLFYIVPFFRRVPKIRSKPKPRVSQLNLYSSISLYCDYIFQHQLNDSSRETCGDKLLYQYQKFHQTSLKRAIKNERQKLVVFSPNEGGLGNRLLALMSSLLFAILNERAFIVNWSSPTAITHLYDFININPLLDSKIWEKWTVRAINDLNSFLCDNYQNDAADVLHITGTDQYFTSYLVNNPHYRDKIKRMFPVLEHKDVFNFWSNVSVTEYAHAPIYGFLENWLLSPTPHIQRKIQQFKKENNFYPGQDGRITIGGQIRMEWMSYNHLGHGVKDFENVYPNEVKDMKSMGEVFLECGIQAVRSYYRKRKVQYFFGLDLTFVQDHIINHAHSHDITRLIYNKNDTVKSHNVVEEGTEQVMKKAAEQAVVMNYLLSECNVLVITSGSTYGNIALNRRSKHKKMIGVVASWDKNTREPKCTFVDRHGSETGCYFHNVVQQWVCYDSKMKFIPWGL